MSLFLSFYLCRFLSTVFEITTESVLRMESIGRDDKKLPTQIKVLVCGVCSNVCVWCVYARGSMCVCVLSSD